MRALFLSILILLFPLRSNSDVLMWQVEDSATVDGDSIFSFVSAIEDDDNHWPAARVKVSGGQLNEPIYLDIWGENEVTGDPELWEGSGENGVWIGNVGGGYWGTGLNQSTFDGEMLEEAVFLMEIGKNTYDETTDTISWVTLAESDPATKNQLLSHIYMQFTLNPLKETAWSPSTFHTVSPEPSSSLLMLIGASFMVLLRPNFKNKIK